MFFLKFVNHKYVCLEYFFENDLDNKYLVIGSSINNYHLILVDTIDFKKKIQTNLFSIQYFFPKFDKFNKYLHGP